MALGFIIMGVYLFHSLFKGKPAGNNPWAGLSHEWSITSPPPEHNFAEIPNSDNGPYDYDLIDVKSTFTENS